MVMKWELGQNTTFLVDLLLEIKQKTAYEIRIRDWSSDVCSSDLISMGAGAGAQKITTDVTGNDTAGMVAGMVASGVTAKGLNGIEAEANLSLIHI